MESFEEKIEIFFKMSHKIEFQKNSDGTYFACIKEFPGCMTEGNTFEEAYAMIMEAKKIWIESVLEDGGEIPLPESEVKDKFSGRILLRLPFTLHKRITESAKKEGISINSYLLSLISEKNKEKEIAFQINEFLPSPPAKTDPLITVKTDPQ